jgi:micrococcal nuclease
MDEKVAARVFRLTVFFAVLIVVAYFFNGKSLQTIHIGQSPDTIQGDGKQNYTYYKVTKVLDGDTLRISINGTLESVRLIGINTPETIDPEAVQCFGKEATARMNQLANTEQVRLEFDESQGLRDTYNRLLAYVYLQDGQMLNRKMIAEGYAYEYTYLTPYKYQKEFRDLQNIARTSARGLWSGETCNGKKTLH